MHAFTCVQVNAMMILYTQTQIDKRVDKINHCHTLTRPVYMHTVHKNTNQVHTHTETNMHTNLLATCTRADLGQILYLYFDT